MRPQWLGLVILSVLACAKPMLPAEAAFLDEHALKVGAATPEAQLVTSSGGARSLGEIIAANDQTVVVFYRGFF
ncbi:MAG TPA: hypothetical protein VFQ53_18760 [Kofleriaceae bacterium]|nr:hypothetical protein [Kofleriaceae bacterium]